jgi:copper homeostasis protein
MTDGTPQSQVRLEVCVDTPAGLAAAVDGGADRIELCAALGLAGLTPSPGLMAMAAATGCETFAMIRPRPGDFRYTPAELDVMRRDIDAVRQAGLAGVVFGASLIGGELDAAILAGLIGHAGDLRVSLHRAFDLAPDLGAALEAAVDLGFERVLTSGGAPNALIGAKAIRELTERAAGRIAVMAGAGVNAQNVADLVRQTGVRDVHGSFSALVAMEANSVNARAVSMGFIPAEIRDTAPAAVAAARANLTRAAGR